MRHVVTRVVAAICVLFGQSERRVRATTTRLCGVARVEWHEVQLLNAPSNFKAHLVVRLWEFGSFHYSQRLRVLFSLPTRWLPSLFHTSHRHRNITHLLFSLAHAHTHTRIRR